MADITKTKGTLQLVAEFTDGDDRTITVDNPKATLTAGASNAVASSAKNNNIPPGDKAAADFSRFKSAKKIAQTTKYLDLS